MKIKLDYTILDIDKRKQIVEEYCDYFGEELSEQNLETLSDYLINCIEKEERRQRKIMTDNRRATINKRETSLEALTSKFETCEDNVYQMFGSNDKNIILSPKISITKKDLAEIPYLQQVKDSIESLKALPYHNYIVHQAIIDLSQTQYIIKEAFTKPVRCGIPIKCQPLEFNWDGFLDFSDPSIVSAFLKNFSSLYRTDDILKDMHWIVRDFAQLMQCALSSLPMLRDIAKLRIRGETNVDIQTYLLLTYDKTYSVEYISALFNRKIPKLIAEEYKKQKLIWYYTNIKHGKWKKCHKCGQIKLQHNLFFSKNNGSKDGFYSICKTCRSRKGR